MPRREWFHPLRQLQLPVVVLAAVSAAVLAWLAWLLVQQDAALEGQRQVDRLQQATETASAALRVAVADLPALAAQGAHGAQEAQGARGSLLHLDLRPGGVELAHGARLLFFPDPRVDASGMRVAQAFDAAEALEFRGDLARALAAYERIASSGGNAATTATAIARVARVQRKMGRFERYLVATIIPAPTPSPAAARGTSSASTEAPYTALIPVSGGTPIRLALPPGVTSAAISPDGRQAVFVAGESAHAVWAVRNLLPPATTAAVTK
jgi:hypothetical protein